MASLLKISGRYYVQFYDRNRKPARKQIPLRTSTKKVAETLARRLEDAYLLGTYDPWIPQPETVNQTEEQTPQRISTLRDAISAFENAKSHLRPDTLRNYKERLSLLQKHVGEARDPMDIKESEIRDFLELGKTTDTTKRNYLRHLRVFFRWLVEGSHIERDPTSKIKLRKPPSKFAKYLTREELDHLCQTIEDEGESLWLSPLIRLTAHLGLRRNEVINLRWQDVDLERGCLTVANSDSFTTKSGRERILPLSQTAVEILGALRAEQGGNPEGLLFPLRNGRISGSYLTHRFAHYRKEAGLPSHITFHSLRHTSASWLVMNGASLEAVRMFLGHSDIQVTQRYAHLAPNVYFRQVTEALND